MQIVQKYTRQIQIKTKSSGFDFFFFNFKGKNTGFKEEGKKDRIEEKIKRDIEKWSERNRGKKKEEMKEVREGERKKGGRKKIF